MKYVSFTAEDRNSFGLSIEGGVYDLGARIGQLVPDLKSLFIAQNLGFSDLPKADMVDYKTGEFSWRPVIDNPEKIICVGLNYEEHRKETGRAKASYPAIFTRFANTLTGHKCPIRLPSISSALDYEGELAIVIGKSGFRVPEEQALGLVAGYTCFNDASVRDWQHHTHQFIPGKNFLETGPLGPELVSPDEMGPIGDQIIETRLNGDIMQSSTLGHMIFSVPHIISYCSSFTRLSPGDVIATGTPGGVGVKRDPQVFMKDGDRVEVTIGGIGTLENTITAEQVDV